MTIDTHNGPTHQHSSEGECSAACCQSTQKQAQSDGAHGAQQSELDRYKQQLVRVSADLQNYKKRVEKERAEWAVTAQMQVINAFLPLIEDIENAVSASASASLDKEKEMWLDGIKLIHKKAVKTLTDLGIQEVDCTVPFDPHFHEALMNVDSPAHQSGNIVQVLAKGYLYKGEVLKHAKVSVAK